MRSPKNSRNSIRRRCRWTHLGYGGGTGEAEDDTVDHEKQPHECLYSGNTREYPVDCGSKRQQKEIPRARFALPLEDQFRDKKNHGNDTLGWQWVVDHLGGKYIHP